MRNRFYVRTAVLMLGLAMLLTLGACGPQAAPTPTAALATPTQAVVLGPEPPPEQSPVAPKATTVAPAQPVGKPVPPKVGAQAFPFSLADLEGNSVSLESMQGKYLMLNFWASWCGPCRAEIPHMVKLHDELEGQDFEILAVNLREDTPKVEAFVKEMDMRFPVVLDQAGAVGNAYFVRGIPTSIFVDKEGVIQIVHTGTLTDALLRQYVDKLMQ